MRLHVPLAAGSVLVHVIGPVTSTPAGKVSVTSVCSELPGPPLVTVTTQLNGCMIDGVATLALLLVRKSTRCLTVVCSIAVLLADTLSGSLADTVTEFW